MQSPRTQLQSHQQQPKSTCSQLKSAFVAFQQTPKRQGQQTMRRLLPACSAFTKPRAHSPTANNLTFISQEGITAMPSMKSPPDTVGQVGWLLSPHDIQMHVGFSKLRNGEDNKRWGVCFRPAQRSRTPRAPLSSNTQIFDEPTAAH